MRVCRKEGTNNLDLWEQVLSYLVNNASSGGTHQASPVGDGDGPSPGEAVAVGRGEDDGDLSSDDGGGGEGAWDDIRELLTLIEREQVLPPLRVSGVRERHLEFQPTMFGGCLPRRIVPRHFLVWFSKNKQ